MKTTILEKVTVQVFEHLSIEITINANRDGFTYKTPKGWGGRWFYHFDDCVSCALIVQYPELEYEIRMNRRNN